MILTKLNKYVSVEQESVAAVEQHMDPVPGSPDARITLIHLKSGNTIQTSLTAEQVYDSLGSGVMQ